jgi:hypothetical protein
LLVEDDINCEVIQNDSSIDIIAPIVRFSSNMHVSGETLVVENTLSVGDGATVNGILTTSNIYNENEIVIQSKDTIRLIGSNIILDGAMETQK